MSFKQQTMRPRRQSYFFTDAPSTMRAQPATRAQRDAVPGAATVEFFRGASGTPDQDPEDDCADAGRQRLPPMPERNEYAGGPFSDQLDDPQQYGTGAHDPVNQAALRRAMGIPPSNNGAGARPDPSQRPPVNSTTVGRLGDPVTESRNDFRTGLSGTAAYDPRTNTSTVGRDATLLGNHTAGGIAGMSPQGMGSRASTADVIRRINKKNRRFYARDARQPDDDEEELANESQVTPTGQPDGDGPSVTRWEQQNPDGSKVVHQRELHPAPLPQHVQTVDIMRPRYPLSMPRAGTPGARQGAAVAARVAHDVSAVADLNRRNAEFWNGRR